MPANSENPAAGLMPDVLPMIGDCPPCVIDESPAVGLRLGASAGSSSLVEAPGPPTQTLAFNLIVLLAAADVFPGSYPVACCDRKLSVRALER